MIKKCVNCLTERPLIDYYKNKNCTGGFDTTCKICFRERASKRYSENKQLILEQTAIRQLGNDEYQKYQKKYRVENKAKLCHLSKISLLRRQQAAPIWLSLEDKFIIQNMYKLRDILSSVFGEKCHVDHIIPICGKTVCGLHVPWNLRVIRAEENLKKNNRLLDEFSTTMFKIAPDQSDTDSEVNYCWDDL